MYKSVFFKFERYHNVAYTSRRDKDASGWLFLVSRIIWVTRYRRNMGRRRNSFHWRDQTRTAYVSSQLLAGALDRYAAAGHLRGNEDVRSPAACTTACAETACAWSWPAPHTVWRGRIMIRDLFAAANLLVNFNFTCLHLFCDLSVHSWGRALYSVRGNRIEIGLQVILHLWTYISHGVAYKFQTHAHDTEWMMEHTRRERETERQREREREREGEVHVRT